MNYKIVLILFFGISILSAYGQQGSRDLMSEYCKDNWKSDPIRCAQYTSQTQEIQNQKTQVLQNPQLQALNATQAPLTTNSFQLTPDYQLVLTGIVIGGGIIAAIYSKYRKKQETPQKTITKSPQIIEPPILKNTYDMISDQTKNTITVGINYLNVHVNSTMITGGLYDIKDGQSYGKYCFTVKQTNTDPRITLIFKESLVLCGWQEIPYKDGTAFEIRGPSATKDEAILFFDKVCTRFENNMQENKISFKRI